MAVDSYHFKLEWPKIIGIEWGSNLYIITDHCWRYYKFHTVQNQKTLMVRLLTLLFVTAFGHGRGSTDLYNSHHVNTDPIYTSEMETFVLKNRFQMQNCLKLMPEIKCLTYLFDSDFFWN